MTFQDDEGLGIFSEEDAKKPEPEAPAEPAPQAEPEPDEEAMPSAEVYAVKTQVGQERNVADLLSAKAKQKKIEVHSVLAPQELRGYVFVETNNSHDLEQLVKVISYARTMLDQDVPFSEIEHFLTPVSAVAKISEGDIVELVSGPFRGEKAKVTRIDDSKEEITVELFEAMVPIPITVKGENVRVLKRHDEK